MPWGLGKMSKDACTIAVLQRHAACIFIFHTAFLEDIFVHEGGLDGGRKEFLTFLHHSSP
jgi:hypothetical protein